MNNQSDVTRMLEIVINETSIDAQLARRLQRSVAHHSCKLCEADTQAVIDSIARTREAVNELSNRLYLANTR